MAQGKKITARKYLGNDAGSWAIFIDGVPFVTGMTKPEVAYYRREAEKIANKEKESSR